MSGESRPRQSSGAAHLALLDRGYQPIEVSEKKSVLQFEITKKMVPRKDIMHFSRQLAVFVQGRRPDHGGAGGDRGRDSDKLLQEALYDMIERLQAGDTFASAAAAHPEAFPNYYIGILSSAELTGNLDVGARPAGRLPRPGHRGPGARSPQR